MKRDFMQEITTKIANAIEAGIQDDSFSPPWVRPHGDGRPFNATSGHIYNGVNILTLWFESMDRGYSADAWGTFKQWRGRDCMVRKGEKGTPVCYVGQMVRETENAAGEMVERGFSFLKWSHVFNVDQVDGDTSAMVARKSLPCLATRLAHCEEIITATGADIAYGGSRAFYRPSTDSIQMPPFEAFTGDDQDQATQSAYSVLFHELTHWTGNPKRLDRQFGERFGDDRYAAEELVAELGAAFLAADTGISHTVREDHTKYLAHWLNILRGDKKAIFTAAAKATAAVDFIREHVNAVDLADAA